MTDRRQPKKKKTFALAVPAGLYANAAFAPRHTVGVLRQTGQAARSVAVPARVAAHARALAAAPGRILPLPEPAARFDGGRDAVERRARLKRAQRYGGRRRAEQSARELDAGVG